MKGFFVSFSNKVKSNKEMLYKIKMLWLKMSDPHIMSGGLNHPLSSVQSTVPHIINRHASAKVVCVDNQAQWSIDKLGMFSP